jgi:hypothetical protein
LQILGTTNRPQIDQRVGYQFHAVVPQLFELKAQRKPLKLVLSRKVRSTHIRNEWTAALNTRFRPRLGVFRLRGNRGEPHLSADSQE